jgi:hypothetical protein
LLLLFEFLDFAASCYLDEQQLDAASRTVAGTLGSGMSAGKGNAGVAKEPPRNSCFRILSG